MQALVIERGKIMHAETSDAPVEDVALPLTSLDARMWILEHFEDLEPRLEELIALLTRPTGPLVARTTGPMAS